MVTIGLTVIAFTIVHDLGRWSGRLVVFSMCLADCRTGIRFGASIDR
jgi:hypothetical protein